MFLKVNFNLKEYRPSWSNQEINTNIKDVKIEIIIEDEECSSFFEGE